ncbi:MAG: ribonuclease H-like domain-containing protein, partial [Desulfobaccales bacterium]|nr:ribonuclease H-like domain-containing protein [Desulfobaccales bacterium]
LGTWEDFLGASRVAGLSRERLVRLRAGLQESLARVADPAYFAPRLLAGEHWRLFRHFRPRAAYLDIETTGIVWPGLLVTVVGLYDGARFRQFVQGYNLEELPEALKAFDLLITYNGTQFDLPVLRAYFPNLRLPPVHLDLRFILARLGFRGGLKRIEPKFGIQRPPEVEGMDGYAAVLLWERYQRGDRTALDLLLEYNRQDVVNLEVLMEGAFNLCQERLLP